MSDHNRYGHDLTRAPNLLGFFVVLFRSAAGQAGGQGDDAEEGAAGALSSGKADLHLAGERKVSL